MKLLIANGVAYLDSKRLCFVEAGKGKQVLHPGTYPLTSQFSHAHGDVLPNADNAGWLGADASCDIILGGVRGRHGLHPSRAYVTVLLDRLESAEGLGQSATMEVE